MGVSYKRLWKLLIDKDMKKKDLAVAANISTYTVNKLNHGENVNTDTIQYHKEFPAADGNPSQWQRGRFSPVPLSD